MSKHRGHRHHHNEDNKENTNSMNNAGNANDMAQAFNNMDMNQLSSLFSSLNMNPNNMNPNNMNANNMNNINDNNIKLLNALRPFLNAQRTDMLDKIIKIYSGINSTNTDINTNTDTNNSSDSVSKE